MRFSPNRLGISFEDFSVLSETALGVASLHNLYLLLFNVKK